MRVITGIVFMVMVSSIFYTQTIYAQDAGAFIDLRDNAKYTWTKIGDQIWMTENLNYETDTGSWCYGNVSSNCSTYGRLYNWETACQVCPEGWHTPTDEDWIRLEQYLGMGKGRSYDMDFRGVKEGGKLKSTGTEYWLHPNRKATDESGFSALPGGYCYDKDRFNLMGQRAFFWTSSRFMETIDGAWSRTLHYNTGAINRFGNIISYGFSVRCIKDE